MMNLSQRLRREGLFWDGLFLASALWIVTGALPLLAIMIAALFTGDIPVDGQPIPDGFPAFTPPWWAAYPLTALLAVLAIGSIPLPLRGTRAFSRGTLAILLVWTVVTTTVAFVGVGLRERHYGGLDYLLLIQIGVFLIVVGRMILGWLRVVPQRWREYVDDDGTVIPPRDVIRHDPPRPWSGLVRRKRS
jgi:hypothetical protein